MARSSARALTLSLTVVLAACAPSPAVDEDAGSVDAGAGDDRCAPSGADCASAADCCGDLVCGAGGVCAEAPGCEGNDTFAGTLAAPAALESLGDDTPLACSGLAFLDVFTVDATAGELLRVTMQTTALAPDTPLAQGQPDLDVYLLSGPPTGLSDERGGYEVQGPIVDVSATELSTERIVYEAPAAGTYYLVVTVWSGPDATYSLELSRGQGCDQDADCPGGEFCRVAARPGRFEVVRECATWTAPGCGAGADEAAGDVHSDANAAPLTGASSGLACAGDIDVFRFDKALDERALLELTSDDLEPGDALLGSVVDPTGELMTTFWLEPEAPGVAYSVGVGMPAGRYFLYLEQIGTGTGELSYDVGVDLQPACRTDADCGGGRTCGQEIFGGGPTQVCALAVDACSDDDSDNSRASATPLFEGTDASAAVCMGGWDVYEIVVDPPAADVVVALSWSGRADLDLYLFAEDGTRLGAGWFGANREEWRGVALRAQKLYAWVSAFACDVDAEGDPVPCGDVQSYTLTLSESEPSVCAEDADCFVGGTSANDSTDSYTCTTLTVPGGSGADAGASGDGDGGDADGGALDGGDGGEAASDPVDAGGAGDVTLKACVRPSPVALVSQAASEACFDDLDCASLLCPDRYCSSSCSLGQADCDASFGAGNGYCFEATPTPLCLLPCADDAACVRLLGADQSPRCEGGECVLP